MSYKVQKSSIKVNLNDSVWNLKTIAWLGLILICVCLLFVGVTKLMQSRLNAVPAEFEGRIVEKTVASNETDEGSHAYYRLRVQVEGQPEPLVVPVTRGIYEEAQVGMRIKRSGKGLEVFRSPAPR